METSWKKLEKKDTKTSKTSKGWSLTDDSRGKTSSKPEVPIPNTTKDSIRSRSKLPHTPSVEYYFSDEEEVKISDVKATTPDKINIT